MINLRVVASKALDRWDVKHVLAEKWLRPASEMQRLGDIARRREEVNSNTGSLAFGSVHFDGSISRRPEGTTIRGKTYVGWPRDVIFSRIDIRNGAIAVLPDEFGPLAFTNEYPIYDVASQGKLLPEFMRLICRTRIFRSQIEALVVGHSGRKRVSAEMFETLLLPVPSIDEQVRIVRSHAERLATVASLRSAAKEARANAIARINAILGLKSPDLAPVPGAFVVSSHLISRWSVFSGSAAVRGLKDELESTYPVRQLGDPSLSTVSYGIQKSPRNRPGENSRPYLRVANVQDGRLDLREIKYIDVPSAQMDTYRLQYGDILLCEGNSAELVGRPALWRDEIAECVHQNHVLRVRPNRDELVPEFVLAFMQTPPSRGHFRRRAKNTTNLSTINGMDVRELLIPVPPRGVQEEVAGIWTAGQEENERLTARAQHEERLAVAETEASIAGA